MIGCGVSIVENMCFIEKHSFHSPLLRQVPACLLFTILEWFFLAIRGDSNPVESRMVSSLQGGTCWWHNCAASRGPILAIGKTIGNRWRCFGWKRLEGLKMDIPLKSMFFFFACNQLAESSILEDLPPAIISDAFAQMVSWLSRYIILLRGSEIMARHQNQYNRQ